MRQLLIFLLFLNVSDLKAQTPPFYRYQEQIDSVLLSGNSVNLNFLTKAYHAQKSVILDYDPESYDKLKYYDFVLFGDGFSHVAFVNERYLILNDRYEVKKEIDPSPGVTSSRLEIFPFVNGLARVKGEQEMLIDGLGNPVQHTVGKKVVQTTRGYFVQTEVDKVVFYQHNHKVLNSWIGVLDRKLNIKQEVVLLKLPEYSVLLKGNGIVFCDSLQRVVELISIDGFYTKSQSDQSVIYDSKGEVSFVSDKNTSQQTRLGLYGGVMVKNGRKGYFDFKKRLFTPLDERDFYPFSAHTFVFRENDMYGFIDFKGKERAAGVYKPLLDYTLEYLSQGDTVYRFFDDKLLKLPVSTKDWMNKKAMGKSLYCFKTDKYRLLDANTGKFLYYEFDTLYNNILSDYVLRNTEIGYSVSSNERFNGLVLEQNGTVMVMDTTFLKQSSPYMDTLYTFGMSLYKFRSQDKKWGYLSSSGAVTCSASYEEVFHFGTSHYKVKLNGKWGIVDLKENQIVPAEYDEILKIHTSFLLGKKGKEVYLFDVFGKQLLSEPIKTAEISLVEGKLKCDYLSLNGERNSFWIN